MGRRADEQRTRPWERDTIVVVHSTTKGMVSMCVHMMVERGELDFDAAVASYWPEFAQAGKAEITLRQAISHQAGIPVIDAPLEPGAGLEWETMVHALEVQAPVWTPGTKHGYHASTWGWLIGETIRRATGRTPGTYLREELCEPWGIDFHLGFGPELDGRVADLADPLPGSPAPANRVETPLRARAFGVAPPRPGMARGSRESRAAEQPAGGGHGNARAIARAFGGFACGGELDGVRLIDESAIPRMWEEQAAGPDEVLGGPQRYGLGFWLRVPENEQPRGPNSFAHVGVGGSLGLADPDHRLGFGYAMNRTGAFMRQRALEDAVYASL